MSSEQSGMLVAHVILVSAQVLLVLTLGLLTSDLGLTIAFQYSDSCVVWVVKVL